MGAEGFGKVYKLGQVFGQGTTNVERVRHCRASYSMLLLCTVSGAARVLEFFVVDTCPGLEEIELNAINLTTFECRDPSIYEEIFIFSCSQAAGKDVLNFLETSAVLGLVLLFQLAASNLPQLKTLWVPATAIWVREILENPYVFCGFSGTWDNIDFAIYLLKCATSPKQMIIDSNYRFYMGCGAWVSGSSTIWSTEIRKRICDQLQGNNMSENIEVIIHDDRSIRSIGLWK
ncbi:hypothetical protein RHMOL_Rhmol08G0243900 [Rhododendron molle]|uniref:Uncharacterized protein n=1 Tax=Rhododendron molle TaxID=49168 RepID=A0ACC0MRU0_RHOML|nr:hypothetical protein RHMOL_Rhmol08G0243900 [Rhododendron molle]